MLASCYELQVAAEQFPRIEQPGLEKLLEDTESAKVRLLVRLPTVSNHTSVLADPNTTVRAVLAVQPRQQNDNPAASTELLIPNTEVSTIIPLFSLDSTAFDYTFLVDHSYNIRVRFFISYPSPESTDTDPVMLMQPAGNANTDLATVLKAVRLDVPLRSTDAALVPSKNAELSVEWCREPSERLLLEVRVKVQLYGGWPFTTCKPFFMLYRWQPCFATWKAVYRSEVLTEKSRASDSKGLMVFRVADLDMNEITDDLDCPLRLEFFHYKMSGKPKMLGHFSTSLASLRHKSKGDHLPLTLSCFPKGELVGHLTMRDLRITATRSFFRLDADFGGPILDRFVFFAVLVSDPDQILRLTKRSEARIFFKISQYNDQGNWEEVYCSETSNRPTSTRTFRFKLTRITERKLNGEHIRRSLSFVFYQRLGRKNIEEIGHFGTTVAELLESPLETSFSLEKDNDTAGYVQLIQAERLQSRWYFELECILREPPMSSSSTDES